MDEFWSEIRNLIVERFNETEIRNLIFDEGINPNALDHSNVLDLARELLLYIKRNYNKEKQYNFYKTLKEERPKIDWPDWPADKFPKNEKPVVNLPVTLKEPHKPKHKESKPAKTKTLSQQYLPWLSGVAVLAVIIIVSAVVGGDRKNNAEANESTQIVTLDQTKERVSDIQPPTTQITVTKQPSLEPPQETLIPTEVVETKEPIDETPPSTPTVEAQTETGLNQVETQSKIKLLTQPSDNSPTLRFIEPGKTLTILYKDSKTGYSYLYIETEEKIKGWVKINSTIKKLNDFDYAVISTGFDESESSASSSNPSSDEPVASNNGIKVSAADCRLQVQFQYTLEADHEIRWSNIPDETDIMTIRVNRISTPQGDLDPLVEQNTLDMGAIKQGVFHVPRTRFSERKYEKNDSFQITLVSLDSAGDEICTTSSVFTWDGRR